MFYQNSTENSVSVELIKFMKAETHTYATNREVRTGVSLI